MKKPFVVCAYFTVYNSYKEHVKKLVDSLLQFNVPYHTEPISITGTWIKQVQHKPEFILQMLEAFPEKNIVYTDADSVFTRYPVLFDQIAQSGSVAVPILEHKKYGRNRPDEMLSGTLFFENCTWNKELCQRWAEECKRNPKEWDQRVLERVVDQYVKLPAEYCYIFDYNYQGLVKDPVVVHYQASREYRKKPGFM